MSTSESFSCNHFRVLEKFLRNLASFLVRLMFFSVLVYGGFCFVYYHAGMDHGEAVTRLKYLWGNVCQQPELPIEIFHRPSLLSGRVVRFQNTSKAPFSFNAVFESGDGKEKKHFRITVEADTHKEIGWREGWTVEYGQKLTLSEDGYLPRVCHITNDDSITI